MRDVLPTKSEIDRRHGGWRPLTDDQVAALADCQWQDDLNDMLSTVSDKGAIPSSPVLKHRKYLKHLAGKGMRIVYTDSGFANGRRALSAWISKNGRPVKRLICTMDARELWLKRNK